MLWNANVAHQRKANHMAKTQARIRKTQGNTTQHDSTQHNTALVHHTTW